MNRRKLVRKNTSTLQSVREEIEKSIPSGSKIHINESLTAYRKRLFGKIHKFKQDNDLKSLWTANGKILRWPECLEFTLTYRQLIFSLINWQKRHLFKGKSCILYYMSKEIVIDNRVYKTHPYYDLYAGSVNGQVIHIIKQIPHYGQKHSSGYMQVTIRK